MQQWQPIGDIPVGHHALHIARWGWPSRDGPAACCTLHHLAWWGQQGCPITRCMVGAAQSGRRDTQGDTGWEHLGWHCPLCQSWGLHQVKAYVALSREELPPTQASLNPACNGKHNLGRCQMLHRCRAAAGDTGIWPRHCTEVSRVAPAPGPPHGRKLPDTRGLHFKKTLLCSNQMFLLA